MRRLSRRDSVITSASVHSSGTDSAPGAGPDSLPPTASHGPGTPRSTVGFEALASRALPGRATRHETAEDRIRGSDLSTAGRNAIEAVLSAVHAENRFEECPRVG